MNEDQIRPFIALQYMLWLRLSYSDSLKLVDMPAPNLPKTKHVHCKSATILLQPWGEQ